MSDINKINPTSPPSVNSTRNVSAKDKQGETSSQVSESTAAPSDKVSFTDNATQLQSLQQTVSAAPVVNKEKIAALAAAVADGSYKVDVEKLARNMIDFEGKLSK